MSNRERGTVTVEVDGTTYTLVLDVNAIVELEDLFGVEFEQVIARVGKNSVKHIRGLVWAALQRHHAGMTVQQAGDWIEAAGGLQGLGQKLSGLAASTTPHKEDVPARTRPQPAQRRRVGIAGVNSTPTPGVSG